MFTGIIEEVGKVSAFDRHEQGARVIIGCTLVLSDLKPGASIAVNGVCLTAVEITAAGFSADLAPETLERTNFPDLQLGAPVNLERPLSLSTRLSGHIVQGHVDGTGIIDSLRDLGDGNWELWVQVPPDLERFLVYKGSITIDGISLTIASVDGNLVRVAIIPHTWQATNLSTRLASDRVNIEVDVLAKHIDKLLRYITLPGPDIIGS